MDEGDQRDFSEWLITRRRFVAGAVLAASSLGAVDALARGVPRAYTADATAGPLGVGPDYGSDGTFMLLRREDFLFIQVDYWNMHVDNGQLQTKAGGPGYIVFTFPPQALGEQAYPMTMAELNAGNAGAGQMAGPTAGSLKIPDAPGGAYAMLAGWSRLAFRVPVRFEIPYTLSGLLNWAGAMSPSLALAAEGGGSIQAPQPPTDKQTAIELPFNLVLSPGDDQNNWSHPVALSLAQGASRYELWRTRLTAQQQAYAAGNPLVPDGGGSVRAVWNFDVMSGSGQPTLSSSTAPNASDLGELDVISTISPENRWNIVHATSDYSLTGVAPIPTRKLWMSARGGFADWHGTWNIKPNTKDSLTDWAQVTTLGRDQYVRVVNAGYLYPWGLPAVKVTISERKFQVRPAPDYRTEAALRQVTFLTVLDPEATYFDAGSANPRNALPFSSVKTLTLRTPPILAAGQPGVNFQSTAAEQILNLDGSHVGFHCVGTDWAGRQISFIANALFIDDDNLDAGDIATIQGAYNGLAASNALYPLRVSNLGGQTVAFAPSAKSGGTDFHVTSITWGAGNAASGPLPFNPTLAIQTGPSDVYTNAQAVVRLAAAEQISGGGELPGNATPSFAYHPTYITNGFGGGNSGEVYLADAAVPGQNQLSAPQSQLIFGNGSGGGLLTPNISISAISRSVGPVAGNAEKIASGIFDPSDYFQGLESAKFLGGLKLSDVLGLANGTGSFVGGLISGNRRAHDPGSENPVIPQVSYSIQQNPSDPTNPADQQLVTTIHWSPPFAGDNPIFITGPSQNISGTFAANLTAVITTNVGDPKDTSYQINGVLDNFGLLLLSDASPLIEIDFTSMTFTKATGSKAKVTPSGINVTFAGPLVFLNDLEQLFAAYCNFDGGPGGATGGASVSVTPAGVVAELSVAIPPIELGMFTLAGIGFDAILTVPLDGVSATTFEFDFASANDPFTLSAGIFGGGGYFQIVLFTHDVKSITLSFDFGAMMAIDLYVASGQASIVAGFSFTETTTGGNKDIMLVGFVKLGGSLTILGIFSVSLEFDLQLAYDSASGNLTGSASMEISVGIFCLHVSFSATASATFAGGGGHSTSSGGVGVGSNLRRRITSGSSQPVATFADQMPLDAGGTTCRDWQTYAAAFVPPAK